MNHHLIRYPHIQQKPPCCFDKKTALQKLMGLTLILLFSQAVGFGQISVTLSAQPPLCGGFSTGKITAAPTGGIGPYTYLWSNGATSNPVLFLPAGNYAVTVTDLVGATATAAIVLTQPDPLSVVITVNTCTVPGTMTANVSGGVPPYMYMWDNGATTPTISNLAPGQYCITVMDAGNCGYLTCQYINPPLSATVTTTPFQCGTQNAGTATAHPINGVAPYTYSWSNGGSTQTIQNLAPGLYTVTVTANNGCTTVASGTVSATPGDFNITLTINHPTCAGTFTGSVSATVSGGVSPYTFQWSNGQFGPSITNLGPGSYTLTVTDAYGCTATRSTILNYQSNLSLSTTAVQPTCANNNNGSVTAHPTGGVQPYSYLWNTGATTQTINNLGSGSYSVTTTDFLGCTAVASTNLTAPPAFTISVNAMNASFCGASNGSVVAIPGGVGSPPFQYHWSTGATTATLNNLPAGSYTVTVTNSAGCTATATAVVTQSTFLNVSISGTNFLCGNSNTGTLSANVTYGTAPFTYAWSNGGSGQTQNNLTSGTYSVTVTSAEGCTGSATKTINGNGGINLQVISENVKCFGQATGKATAIASGGTPPYSYHWSNGATTFQISNLAVGQYSVTVTDAMGCTKTGMATISQPPLLTLSIQKVDGSCGAGGSVSAIVDGGTSPYTYLWSNGATTPNQSNVPPGNYTLTVTDAQGCTAHSTVTIQTSSQPTCSIQLTQAITTIGGTNGMLTAQVAGGTAPFTYLWSNGQTGVTASNLGAGTYSVAVIDAHNCQTTCQFILYDPAKIGDFVWNDTDMDGIQDANETGIGGVSVTITGTSVYGGNVNQSVNTDATGMYMFLVQPGSYKLTFATPANFQRSPANQGNNDAVDSDMNTSTGMTPFITLSSGETNLTIDAGFYPGNPCDQLTDPGTICCNQTLCGPGQDPAPIVQATPATGGSGNIEYLWMFSHVPGPFDPGHWTAIPNSNGPDYDPGPLSQTTYFVRCARRENCPYLESNIVTVTVDDVAVADITDPGRICVGDHVDFLSHDNGPTATYSWTFSGGAVPSVASTQNVLGVVWNSFGLKTIHLTVVRDGCVSTDELLVIVSDSPTYCGNALTITAEPMGRTAVNIEWEFSGSDSVGRNYEVEWAWGENPFLGIGEVVAYSSSDDILYFKTTHPNARAGRNAYRVKLEDSSGAIYYSNTAVVKMTSKLPGKEPFPNPFDEELFIKIPDDGWPEYTIELQNPNGVTLAQQKVFGDSSTAGLKTGDLAPGLYFLVVKVKGQPNQVYKVVK